MQSLSRRQALGLGLASLSTPWLTACGGGGDAAGPISRYSRLSLPTPVSSHTALSLGGTQVAIFGGSRADTVLSASVDYFDAATGHWTTQGEMSTGRSESCVVQVSSTVFFVHGGNRSLNGSQTAEWFDTATGVTEPAVASPSRLYHTATVLADGRILVAGGVSSEGYAGGVSPTLELWDPSDHSWRYAAQPMIQARHAHTATLMPDGKVLLTGGYSATGMASSAELFDPATETTQLISSALLGRAGHGCVLLSNGDVLIAGGEMAGTQTQAASPGAVRLVSGTWAVEALTSVPALGWVGASVAANAQGQLIFFGGQDATTHAVAGAVSIGASTGMQALESMPEARQWHSVTRLGSGQLLILGGERDGALFSSALIFS
ncbi:MAG TPA: kelch repeat-containing protein [Aquabacterium sp.]|nr:kelch repeat-containing protein [Aquabacterium sp.]